MKQLPEKIEALFWEYDPQTLSLERDRGLIIGRILSSAGWDGVKWLRSLVSDRELTDWLSSTRGSSLSPPRLRFWELVLDLPHSQVNEWLSGAGRKIWDGRTVS